MVYVPITEAVANFLQAVGIRAKHRGVRALERGSGLWWLPGHRRPLSGADERAGSEAARDDSPQDPATHARAGRVRPAPRARAPQRLRAPRGEIGRAACR